MSLFLYGNPVEILRKLWKSVETYGTVRISAEKIRGMEMSLFFYGNPVEILWKSCGNEGKAWK